MKYCLLLTYTLISAYLYAFVIQISRSDFSYLIGGMSLLFAFYALLYFHLKKYFPSKFLFILVLAIFFRLIVIPHLPSLSDDFYRFIWDGTLTANGENPFLYLPQKMADNPHFQSFFPQGLFQKLNSPNYYTVYPPICQGIFAFAAAIFPKDIFLQVIILKVAIFFAEMGSLFFLYKLLKAFELPVYLLALYALNPLAIVELTGNIHFEAFMIMGILGAAFFISRRFSQTGDADSHRLLFSAFFFAIAICAKLLPIMFLPFLYKKMGFKKMFFYLCFVAFFCLMMFLPFWDINILSHISQSASLYFQSFEFNASLYYLLRAIGYQIWGYNMIHVLGKILPIAVIIGIYLGVKKDFGIVNPAHIWLKQMFYALSLYLFCATTVNPWYVVPLIAFSPFVDTRYAIVWSFLLPFSYFAYKNGGCEENLWAVLGEYTLLLGCFALEKTKIMPKIS